jgi:hypothetical protein
LRRLAEFHGHSYDPCVLTVQVLLEPTPDGIAEGSSGPQLISCNANCKFVFTSRSWKEFRGNWIMEGWCLPSIKAIQQLSGKVEQLVADPVVGSASHPVGITFYDDGW